MVSIQEALAIGQEHERAGRLAEAEQVFRQVVEASSNSPLAHTHLGILLMQRGDLAGAEACFRRALELAPHVAQSHANLGRVLHDKGEYASAERCYQQAVQLAPNRAREHFNLGAMLQKVGKTEEACASYRRALELNPGDATTHCNLGVLLAERRQFREAEDHYRRAIAANAGFIPSYNNLSVALGEQGRHAEAAAVCRDALARAPQFAPLYCNLARSLQQLGQLDEAIAQARRGIELHPDSPSWCNLGMCYQQRGQLDEAIEAYRAALGQNPQDWQTASNLVYALNYHPGYQPQAVYEEHRQWARRHADTLAPAHPHFALDRAPARRLRIGYVSGHFRAHAVAAFTEPMLAAHDHSNFEIFCYSNFPLEDETTRRFRASADHWRQIAPLRDEEACEAIRRDQIDILVDLAGHINGNRLLAFARRPAPIQVTYLGYQNTTGMTAIDYRLTDDHADPPGATDPYYIEKLVRLPRSFFCYLPDRQAPPPGPLPALARGFVTFGSFNQFSKITPEVLETWARLLASVPRSRLILLAHRSPWLEARVAELFARHGVERARVELAPRRKHHEYLELITSVDVALDSFPFNGHTTTCDSLWQGVPVVTMLGSTYASRFGSTAHVNLGLDELMADSPARYVEIASRLAADLPRLAELRAALRTKMLDSPLLDAQGFTRRLEAAYREMWARWSSAAS